MTYYCKLCDKSICAKSRYKHFISTTLKTLNMSILTRYVIVNPIFDEVVELTRVYINIYNRKYKKYAVRCFFL